MLQSGNSSRSLSIIAAVMCGLFGGLAFARHAVELELTLHVVDAETGAGIGNRTIQVREFKSAGLSFSMGTYSPVATLVSGADGTVVSRISVRNDLWLDTYDLGCRIVDPKVDAILVKRASYEVTHKIELTIRVRDCNPPK